MGEWRPMDTAPRDKAVLLWGTMLPFGGITANGPLAFTGYWDAIGAVVHDRQHLGRPVLRTNALASASCAARRPNPQRTKPMSDGDMVERVAEALAQSFRDIVAEVSGDSWEDTGVTLPSRKVFERYARAAIEAMREPTDMMIAAGISERHILAVPTAWTRATVNIFRAMIDAALNTGETE